VRASLRPPPHRDLRRSRVPVRRCRPFAWPVKPDNDEVDTATLGKLGGDRIRAMSHFESTMLPRFGLPGSLPGR
jgi:hypothetical protein